MSATNGRVADDAPMTAADWQFAALEALRLAPPGVDNDAVIRTLRVHWGCAESEQSDDALDCIISRAKSDLNYEQLRETMRGSPTRPAAPSWHPVDLKPILAGDQTDEPPSILARADGVCLLYRERVHGLHGEPEACKGWTVLAACVEQLAAGEDVVYADFEDTAGNVLQRLIALGAAPDAALERFHYIQPNEPADDATLDALVQLRPALVVFDGITEAFAVEGLKIADNDEIAVWQRHYARRFARAGSAVVLIDHVTKDRESRGRYAIGGQHKLAGIDVAYSLQVVRPFGRGREGLVKIRVEKDRPGHVRAHQDEAHVVAMVNLRSGADGDVSVRLEPAREVGEFRPTFLMERISLHIEDNPGASRRDIRDDVKGKSEHKDKALRLLVSEGYVESRPDGASQRAAIRHHSMKPFREVDE